MGEADTAEGSSSEGLKVTLGPGRGGGEEGRRMVTVPKRTAPVKKVRLGRPGNEAREAREWG